MAPDIPADFKRDMRVGLVVIAFAALSFLALCAFAADVGYQPVSQTAA